MEMMEKFKQWGKWGPDDEFGTLNYIGDEERKYATICADTRGCEVIPNETNAVFQPWHWIVIPMIGHHG